MPTVNLLPGQILRMDGANSPFTINLPGAAAGLTDGDSTTLSTKGEEQCDITVNAASGDVIQGVSGDTASTIVAIMVREGVSLRYDLSNRTWFLISNLAYIPYPVNP